MPFSRNPNPCIRQLRDINNQIWHVLLSPCPIATLRKSTLGLHLSLKLWSRIGCPSFMATFGWNRFSSCSMWNVFILSKKNTKKNTKNYTIQSILCSPQHCPLRTHINWLAVTRPDNLKLKKSHDTWCSKIRHELHFNTVLNCGLVFPKWKSNWLLPQEGRLKKKNCHLSSCDWFGLKKTACTLNFI